MKKSELVETIIAHLQEKVSLHMTAARAAHEEATHEDNRAEDQYDTRSLEASYLAAGQARQTAEVAAALQEFSGLFLKKFPPDEPIDLSALVQLQMKKDKFWYFIGPAAGGLEVELDGQTVLVITPQSPMGQHLTGKKKGDVLKLKIAGFIDEYKILSVT